MSRKRDRKILVLGADGFIGSNITKKLILDKKNKVIAFDFFNNGKAKNLTSSENLEFLSGNFLNREDLRKSLVGIDYVFHFISMTTPGSSMKDPLIDVETNIKGSVVLLDECVKAGVKRIIFSSSGGAIYGNQNKNKYKELDLTNPISPYSISKLTIEKYLEYYRLFFGLDYLVFRYSNPYGPGQNITGSQGVIPIFLNLIRQNKVVKVFGDGKIMRDYIFIEDLVRITLSMCFKKNNKYRVYNIGRGKAVSLNYLVSVLEEVVGGKVKIEHLPDRKTDVKRVALDISRISKEVRVGKFKSLNKGVRETWEWIETVW